MAFTRDWLKEQIKSYIHDSSDKVEQALDTWIDLGAKRVSQIMQCVQMEEQLTRNAGATEDYIIVPALTRRILGVQWQNYAGQFVNIRSVPRHLAGQYKGTGTPGVYYIENGNIYPAPFMDANYRAQVINEAVIPVAGTETTDVLTAFPFVFLNATLTEAYDWKQDPDSMARYRDKWTGEAAEVTARYISERGGDTPAMRAM